eukprot:490424_1
MTHIAFAAVEKNKDNNFKSTQIGYYDVHLLSNLAGYATDKVLKAVDKCPLCCTKCLNIQFLYHMDQCLPLTGALDKLKYDPNDKSYDLFQQFYKYSMDKQCFSCGLSFWSPQDFGIHLYECVGKRNKNYPDAMQAVGKLLTAPIYPIYLTRNQYVSIIYSSKTCNIQMQRLKDIFITCGMNNITLGIALKIEQNNNNNSNNNNVHDEIDESKTFSANLQQP